MRRLVAICVVVFTFSPAFAQEKAADPLAALKGLKPWEVPYVATPVADSFGATDTLWLELMKGSKAGEWVLYFHVFNDESLLALSFPIRHDSLMRIDSASLVGTRIDFFQTKLLNKKPSVPNTVTIGLFSALAPGAPPLPPGKGLVLKMFFTAPPERPITIRSVAPIMMPPNLELVTPFGAPINPAVVRIGAETQAGLPLPKAVPESKSTTKKKTGR